MLTIASASPSHLNFLPISDRSPFHGVRIKTLVCIRLQPPPISSIRSPNASRLVMMARREEEMKEIRAKTTEELNQEVVDLKGDLFMLRLQRSVKKEFKPSEFRRMKKRIARMLTVKREREMEEGIKKRESRKLDRQWKKNIVVRPSPALIKLREKEEAEDDK